MNCGRIYPFYNKIYSFDSDCNCRDGPYDKAFLMIESALSSFDTRLQTETTKRKEADEAINQTITNIQKQVTANTTELAKTRWTQTVIDLQ